MIRLSNRGDTLIEVLLAIAIVSFILVAAYVTANKNTAINQDTQERSQALQLATSQLEFLHNADIGSNNCFDISGNPVGTPGNNTPCIVKADGTPASSDDLAYTIAITSSGATYRVDVSWDSLASQGQSNVTLYYQP